MLESSHIYCIDKFCQVTYQFNIPCFLKFYCFLLDFLLFLHSESWANWTFWWILPFFILFIFSHSVILQVSTKRQHSVLCWFPLHEGIEWDWIPLLCPHSGSGLLPDAVGWGEQGELKIKGGELFSGCRGALQNCSLCWASLRLSKAQDGWTHPSSSALLWKWHRVVTSLSILDKARVWCLSLPCREPYTVAVRSVTLKAMPPSPEFCRSEILCAGFQIYSSSSSSCTVSIPTGPSSALLSPHLSWVCKGNSKVPPKKRVQSGCVESVLPNFGQSHC